MIIINPRVVALLKEDSDIDINEAILYVLSIYFNLPTNLFSTRLTTRVNTKGIFEKDPLTDEIIWNIPPVVGEQTKFENTTDLDLLVKQYRELFRRADKTKAGDKKTIERKFKVFFKQHPDVTPEEILAATKRYIEDMLLENGGKYLQNANYFIRKERNPAGSKLETYLEIIREEEDNSSSDNEIIDPWKG